jgi:ketosteroid isomerase-like protein
VTAQDLGGNLHSELAALHAKWFKAFDWHDAATMNQMETKNLVLVMPDGFVIALDKPRTGTMLKTDPGIERTLSKVSVRRFGDTAILTGTLTTRSVKENSRESTTVVFVETPQGWKIASAQWTTIKK